MRWEFQVQAVLESAGIRYATSPFRWPAHQPHQHMIIVEFWIGEISRRLPENKRMSSVICIDKRENDPYRIGVPKGDGLWYGSTGTISTDLQTESSSLSQASLTSQSYSPNKIHGLSLDLTSVANSDRSEDSVLLCRSESSYSDTFEGEGYYDLLARHRQWQSKDAWSFIKNSLFTLCNFKPVISFSIWFMSYMIMGVFGGSVAYLHFERSDKSVPDPLPDFGYDVIPVSKPANHESFYSSSVV